MKHIANIITQILTYSDNVGTTDNPQMRNFDWSRKFSSLAVVDPDHGNATIPAGESVTIFDGLRSNDLADDSVLSISSIIGSLYEMTYDSGTAPNWRIARSIASLGDVIITINNNSVAKFEFSGATLTGVQAGDILSVSGDSTFDSDPYTFSPINSGHWVVLSVSGNIVQATRPTGEPFSGVTETQTSVPSDQIGIYSASGVQAGDKLEIKAGFSPASYKTYKIVQAEPDRLVFVSTTPIPEETITYPDPVGGHSIFAHTESKRVVYLESDQEVSVQFNDDAGDTVRVCPFKSGDPDLVGYLHKAGPAYKVVVVNKSVNEANILYFTAE